ncbi:MAG: TRAP transporter small permease, partial [Spirochaetales bacterium]|nr:TRAP transporter small permease [Spirochaetales bacterium]
MDTKENGFIKSIRTGSNLLNKVVEQLCLVSMASMTFVVLLGVFFRYILQMPLSWTEELSRYLMIWAASLAISLGIKGNDHVGLTILVDSAKSKIGRVILETLIFFITLIFLVIMIYYSIQMVIEAKWQISQGLGITMVLPTLAIPVSMIIGLV